MLITRPAKREKATFFGRELLLDILNDGKPIGEFRYNTRDLSGVFSIDGKDYRADRASDRSEEGLFHTLTRVATGGEKPPANPYVLTASDGRVLASAEPVKTRFEVTHGGETYVFRKRALFSRPYHLYRMSSNQSLGWVGQEKYFTKTLTMDLSAEFDAPFQIFLLVLLLNATMKALESAGA